ncbi:MAG: amidohydrolase family protein [Actinomycetota bacterium]|nr:amidohydrolase family protein [Actinomycetota bacterium]
MIVDAHHHFWNLEREALPWMTDDHSAIRRTFEPGDLEPLLRRVGVSQTVLVQAACSDSDTDSMFEQAARHQWIGGVVAWVDLRSPPRALERLGELARQPKLRGIRHLIHDEPDPHWVLQDEVLESLALLEQRGLILELPCVYPRHLGDVPELAAGFPQLTIVIDHLGKPPLRSDEMARWAGKLRAAASYGNVAAKISGLNTALAASDWDADHLAEAVAVALDAFGPDRLVCGSDWPVALLNGDYERVWRETVRVIERLAPLHEEPLLAGNARRLYDLDPAVAPAAGAPS